MMTRGFMSWFLYTRNNYNVRVTVLILAAGLSIVSWPISAVVASAQSSSSNSTPSSVSSNNSTSNDTTVKQMGICQVGVKSPCNNGGTVQ